VALGPAGAGVAGVAQVALAVEQVERAVHPEPQATQAAREAVRVAPALRNPPAARAKAVRVAIALLNPPAARARIASIPQGRELGRGALPTLKAERAAPPDSDKRSPRATPPFHAWPPRRSSLGLPPAPPMLACPVIAGEPPIEEAGAKEMRLQKSAAAPTFVVC
jgi:hypothetical protein